MRGELTVILMSLGLLRCAEPRIAPSERDTVADTGDEASLGDSAIDGSGILDNTRPQLLRPPFCAVAIPPQYFGPEGTCAPLEPEARSADCSFEYDGIPTASTLCDLDENRCTRPSQSCAAGWCYVPPVSFLSGQSSDLQLALSAFELGDLADPPQRKRVSRGFFVQATEVTRSEFERVMGYSHPEKLPCVEMDDDGRLVSTKGDCPAAFGSIFEAMQYANRLGSEWGLPACYDLVGCRERTVSLNGAELTIRSCESSRFAGVDCRGLRLPTHAEAELAARAGTTFAYPTGPIASIGGDWFTSCDPSGPPARTAWHCSNAYALRAGCPTSDGQWPPTCLSPQPVRSLLANPFGIFDAQGNLAEYAQKIFCTAEPGTDVCSSPQLLGDADEVFQTGDIPLLTGGAYLNTPVAACSMCRTHAGEHYSNYHLQVMGLRLVRSALGDCSALVIPQ